MVARRVEIVIDCLEITGSAPPTERDVAQAVGRALTERGLPEPVRRAAATGIGAAVRQAVRS